MNKRIASKYDLLTLLAFFLCFSDYENSENPIVLRILLSDVLEISIDNKYSYLYNYR